jgi:hypothetical protein
MRRDDSEGFEILTTYEMAVNSGSKKKFSLADIKFSRLWLPVLQILQ